MRVDRVCQRLFTAVWARPDDNAAMMMEISGAVGGSEGGGEAQGGAQSQRGGGPRVDPSIYPAEFRSGLHSEEITVLREFI